MGGGGMVGGVRIVVVLWVGSWYCLFFFFQAEDGIRDRTVTGVQTCALPIYGKPSSREQRTHALPRGFCSSRSTPTGRWNGVRPRSEERRVGKECRARGAPEQ